VEVGAADPGRLDVDDHAGPARRRHLAHLDAAVAGSHCTHRRRMAEPDPLLDALRTAHRAPDAEFRDGQREAIEALVDERSRVLVVQRTGWGKSAVYFLTTHLLRSRGSGPHC
jgi:superfamily II DNA helicase RecQ